jgi:hypothetical protein
MIREEHYNVTSTLRKNILKTKNSKYMFTKILTSVLILIFFSSLFYSSTTPSYGTCFTFNFVNNLQNDSLAGSRQENTKTTLKSYSITISSFSVQTDIGDRPYLWTSADSKYRASEHFRSV